MIGAALKRLLRALRKVEMPILDVDGKVIAKIKMEEENLPKLEVREDYFDKKMMKR